MTLLRPSRIPAEFQYLDGFRAVAALVVVVYHAYLFTGATGSVDRAMPWLGNIVGWGFLGVPIFIVLSGYVLMLPVAKTDDYSLRGGGWSFIKRRAKRILPPYYAALAITLLLIVALPIMQSPSGTQWDTKIPLSPGAVVSHVLMLQDLRPDWIGKIDGPLWSVAVEWQIYFLMPLVLLPLWRRVRVGWIVACLGVLTIAAVLSGIGDFVHPWFVLLFVLGMLAAKLTVRGPIVPRAGVLALCGIALIPLSIALRRVTHTSTLGWVEIATGIAIALTLVWAGQESVRTRVPAVLRPLQSRPMLFLGLISYSIYLLHSPLLGLANLLLAPLHLSVLLNWLLLTLVAAPIAVVACWLFFLCVERHFLNSRQRHASRTLEGAKLPADLPTAS